LRRRTLIISMLAVALAVGSTQPSALAGRPTRVRSALFERQELVRRAKEVRRVEAELSTNLERRIERLQRLQRSARAGVHAGEVDRRNGTIDVTPTLVASAHRRLQELRHWLATRVKALHQRYGSIQRWLDTAGIFRVCPVPAFTTINDNFGQIVRLPHVPIHVHHGSDVGAPAGTQILAPFDGYVSSSSSKLGGLEIRVFGDAGYVYNAHAASVARYGWVHAGAVVGYIGATGDATGPHDHLEWHPHDGPAVDPYPLLAAACLPTSG
jgi:murein DD-endopeptidase MepM/ murein hydrolase activator NlpD